MVKGRNYSMNFLFYFSVRRIIVPFRHLLREGSARPPLSSIGGPFLGNFAIMGALKVFGCLEGMTRFFRSVVQGLLTRAHGIKFSALGILYGSALRNGLPAFSFRSWRTLAVWIFETPRLNMYTWVKHEVQLRSLAECGWHT